MNYKEIARVINLCVQRFVCEGFDTEHLTDAISIVKQVEAAGSVMPERRQTSGAGFPRGDGYTYRNIEYNQAVRQCTIIHAKVVAELELRLAIEKNWKIKWKNRNVKKDAEITELLGESEKRDSPCAKCITGPTICVAYCYDGLAYKQEIVHNRFYDRASKVVAELLEENKKLRDQLEVRDGKS